MLLTQILALRAAANKQPVMSVEAFVKARKASAAKIAKEARAKGGLATLTATHFEAKGPAYDHVLAMSRVLESMEDGLKKAVATISAKLPSASQEVFGEMLQFLQHPQAY